MDTATRELIEACRLATEPTGIETPTYVWFMSHEEQRMALDQVRTLNGLSQETIKFCFWLQDEYDKLNRRFAGGGRFGGIVETHDEYGDKVNASDMSVLEEADYDMKMRKTHDPEGYVWTLLRSATWRVQSWQEREREQAAEASRIAHANTKDAIRMRARRAAGKVKARPARPQRSLAQKVEDRRKMVETREANLAAFSQNRPLMTRAVYLGAIAKAKKSIGSAKKALATAEGKLAESLRRS